jgi:hypothetical protein
VTNGQLLPKDVEQIHINMRLRDEQDKKTAHDFAEKKEGTVTTYLEEYKTYLNAMPKIVEFSEIATKTTAVEHKEDKDGCSYVEKKVKEYSESGKISYTEALNKLSIEEPEKVQEYLRSTLTGN